MSSGHLIPSFQKLSTQLGAVPPLVPLPLPSGLYLRGLGLSLCSGEIEVPGHNQPLLQLVVNRVKLRPHGGGSSCISHAQGEDEPPEFLVVGVTRRPLVMPSHHVLDPR